MSFVAVSGNPVFQLLLPYLGRLPLLKQTGVTQVASLSFQCPSSGTASKSFRQSAFPRGRHASPAWASILAWVFPSELLPSGLPECARLRIPASLDRSRDPLSDPHDLLSLSALLLARSLAASAAVQAALAVLEAQATRTLIAVAVVVAAFCSQAANAGFSANRLLPCGLVCDNGHKPSHLAAVVAAVLLLDAFAVFLAVAVVVVALAVSRRASEAQFAEHSPAAAALPCLPGVDAPMFLLQGASCNP